MYFLQHRSSKQPSIHEKSHPKGWLLVVSPEGLEPSTHAG